MAHHHLQLPHRDRSSIMTLPSFSLPLSLSLSVSAGMIPKPTKDDQLERVVAVIACANHDTSPSYCLFVWSLSCSVLLLNSPSPVNLPLRQDQLWKLDGRMQDTRALRQAIRFILLYLIQYVHGWIYSPQPFLYSILQLPEKNR